MIQILTLVYCVDPMPIAHILCSSELNQFNRLSSNDTLITVTTAIPLPYSIQYHTVLTLAQHSTRLVCSLPECMLSAVCTNSVHSAQ